MLLKIGEMVWWGVKKGRISLRTTLPGDDRIRQIHREFMRRDRIVESIGHLIRNVRLNLRQRSFSIYFTIQVETAISLCIVGGGGLRNKIYSMFHDREGSCLIFLYIILRMLNWFFLFVLIYKNNFSDYEMFTIWGRGR